MKKSAMYQLIPIRIIVTMIISMFGFVVVAQLGVSDLLSSPGQPTVASAPIPLTEMGEEEVMTNEQQVTLALLAPLISKVDIISELKLEREAGALIPEEQATIGKVAYREIKALMEDPNIKQAVVKARARGWIAEPYAGYLGGMIEDWSDINLVEAIGYQPRVIMTERDSSLPHPPFIMADGAVQLYVPMDTFELYAYDQHDNYAGFMWVDQTRTFGFATSTISQLNRFEQFAGSYSVTMTTRSETQVMFMLQGRTYGQDSLMAEGTYESVPGCTVEVITSPYLTGIWEWSSTPSNMSLAWLQLDYDGDRLSDISVPCNEELAAGQIEIILTAMARHSQASETDLAYVKALRQMYMEDGLLP